MVSRTNLVSSKTKRKCIVKPEGLLKGKPDLSKPPPFLHMDPYMRIVYDEKFAKHKVYFQIYTYGEYGVHMKHVWQWRGNCYCGVTYGDPDPKAVKKRMDQHIAMAHHEPGAVYTLVSTARYLEAKRQKNRSKA